MLLGGKAYTQLTANTDVNDLDDGKYYLKSNSVSLTNFSYSGGFMFYTEYQQTGTYNYKSQYAYGLSPSDNEGVVYRRTKWANAWTSWTRIDNFGCNTASDLASLLGGIQTKMKGIRYRTIQIQGGEGSYVDSEEAYESSSIAVISGPGLLAISIVNMITEQSLTQGGEYASFNQSDSPAILLSKVNGKIRYTKYNPSVLPNEINVIFISPRYIG